MRQTETSAHRTDSTGGWYHVPRLAFQPEIVWWALFAGQVIDWPFRKRLKKSSDERSRGSAIA